MFGIGFRFLQKGCEFIPTSGLGALSIRDPVKNKFQAFHVIPVGLQAECLCEHWLVVQMFGEVFSSSKGMPAILFVFTKR